MFLCAFCVLFVFLAFFCRFVVSLSPTVTVGRSRCHLPEMGNISSAMAASMKRFKCVLEQRGDGRDEKEKGGAERVEKREPKGSLNNLIFFFACAQCCGYCLYASALSCWLGMLPLSALCCGSLPFSFVLSSPLSSFPLFSILSPRALVFPLGPSLSLSFLSFTLLFSLPFPFFSFHLPSYLFHFFQFGMNCNVLGKGEGGWFYGVTFILLLAGFVCLYALRRVNWI